LVHAYLSGPIIHSDLRKDDFYQLVVDVLEKKGITVFAPQFLSRASPEVIYERDVEQLKRSDLIIAEVSYPSHGVGMEIMLGIELEKPLILFRQTKAKPLSFMVRGAPGSVILEYNDLKEVRDTLQNHSFENLILQQCHNCQSQIAEIAKDGFRCFGCDTELKKAV
jgi:nucleoside 2-deoxyribosyltransferase